MATDFTEETAADAVIESFAPSTNPRLREILASLVQHLHAFAREVELTIPEWEAAIDFLTRVGQKCDDERQEFILLSDVVGLVDAGRDDQQQEVRGGDRVDGARAVPRGGIAGP